MVGVIKSLMTVVLAASALSEGRAARFRHISKLGRGTEHRALNTTKASNSSVVANSTLRNSSVALANQTAMAIPRPGKLRICNAYSEGSLTATVGYPKPRVKSSSPAPYKSCVQMAGDFKAGDTVEIYFGNGLKTAVYLPYPPYADHATILLVVFKTTGQTEGFDIKMQYFRNLKYPQVAAVDCAPRGTPPAKMSLEHLDPKAPTESVEFNKVGPIDQGLTNVLLDGKPATGGQFNAQWTQEYAIMRIGASDVAIYPPATSLGSHGHHFAITSCAVTLFWLSMY